jgi:hypothetical protein
MSARGAESPAKNGVARSSTDRVAQQVQHACKQLDDEARVVYVGCNDDGRTVVRVSAGATASVAALQRALAELLPLARVRASEDVLSGAMQAEVVVPTREDERALARARAKDRPALRALRAAGAALAVCAASLWVASHADI